MRLFERCLMLDEMCEDQIEFLILAWWFEPSHQDLDTIMTLAGMLVGTNADRRMPRIFGMLPWMNCHVGSC